MSLLQTEFVTLQAAIETTFGVQAAAGWMQHQPNPAGIQDFYANIKSVARSPISANLMDEKGDVVDLDAMPKFVHDLNKDLLDRYGESIFRSTTKYPGGTGTGRWQVAGATGISGATVTSLTATAITVSAGGALPAGTLIFCRGFANALNNGLRVVGAASGATSITVSGGATEASPPTGALIEVCGVQGTAADITVDASGRLTSTALDFTTLGLQVGAWLWLGGGTAAVPGALGFATAADRGFARITAVAAHLITPDRRTQTWTTDAGAGKTIQIFFGPWLRNVPGTSADYKRVSHTLELALPNVGPGGVTDYVYPLGATLGTFELNAPLTDKIVATLGFIGTDVSDPSITRATGAATSMPPLNTGALNTVSELRRLWIANQSDETVILADVESWKLTINNNVKPYKKQGVLGAADMIFGKFQPKLTIAGVLTQDDAWKANRDFRTCSWATAVRNNDGGVVYDLPAMTLDLQSPAFAAADAVSFSVDANTFRDTTYGYVCGQTTFPFLPAT